MIKINDCTIERTSVGWLVDYPGYGVRFPLNMPLRKVLFSVLCSLQKIDFRSKPSFYGRFYR